VVLKAMTKEREGRYATARELADDLRRFLDDKPIRARRPTLAERAAKWARRHKPLVRTAAVLLTLALAGALAGILRIRQEQAQTQAALEQVKAQWLLTRAKEVEAQGQRRRAEENFHKACTGVTQLLLRLEESRWAGVPVVHELRRALAEQGVQFLQEFLDENSNDPAVRLETGRAYVVLANVYGLQGERARARQAYGKAIVLLA